ncbi:hypothetical protein CYMTET_38706 [Cymbomonas tetramitiformis]|uniref:Transmembrane protein n=1 Tax=Cymbomonas tetramitiformis TaxID=36881 RepID=A0AAE0F6B9_9CHLO|nr:hypothetical protein CYMTET_38706 [Cymbomonas tetramitiformis]
MFFSAYMLFKIPTVHACYGERFTWPAGTTATCCSRRAGISESVYTVPVVPLVVALPSNLVMVTATTNATLMIATMTEEIVRSLLLLPVHLPLAHPLAPPYGSSYDSYSNYDDNDSGSSNTGAIVGGVIGALVFLGIFGGGTMYYLKKRKQLNADGTSGAEEGISSSVALPRTYSSYCCHDGVEFE